MESKDFTARLPIWQEGLPAHGARLVVKLSQLGHDPGPVMLADAEDFPARVSIRSRCQRDGCGKALILKLRFARSKAADNAPAAHRIAVDSFDGTALAECAVAPIPPMPQTAQRSADVLRPDGALEAANAARAEMIARFAAALNVTVAEAAALLVDAAPAPTLAAPPTPPPAPAVKGKGMHPFNASHADRCPCKRVAAAAATK